MGAKSIYVFFRGLKQISLHFMKPFHVYKVSLHCCMHIILVQLHSPRYHATLLSARAQRRLDQHRLNFVSFGVQGIERLAVAATPEVTLMLK